MVHDGAVKEGSYPDDSAITFIDSNKGIVELYRCKSNKLVYMKKFNKDGLTSFRDFSAKVGDEGFTNLANRALEKLCQS